MLYISTSDLKHAINSSCPLVYTKTLYQTIPHQEILLKKCLSYNGTPNAYNSRELSVYFVNQKKYISDGKGTVWIICF